MDRATKSTVIVASLFPKQVRSRLFEPMDGSGGERKKNHSVTSGSRNWSVRKTSDSKNDSNITTTTTTTPLSLSSLNDQHNAAIPLNPIPKTVRHRIADSFPETTILFADIAGFTSWSASRNPEEVFELLETLYGAFDKLALKHKVFKVETIGDSYLAAAGLPDPQEDHAVIMTRFARDCLIKASQLIEEMARGCHDVEENDTRKLNIRVGLHSGPVTAGILRGQKSRFQIFGDTVNTASRMESTGRPGKIQISEATAHELIQRGKSNWLTHREEKIVAKGKGEMTTYWVSIPTFSTSGGSLLGGSTRHSKGDRNKMMWTPGLVQNSCDGVSLEVDEEDDIRRASLVMDSIDSIDV